MGRLKKGMRKGTMVGSQSGSLISGQPRRYDPHSLPSPFLHCPEITFFILL